MRRGFPVHLRLLSVMFLLLGQAVLPFRGLLQAKAAALPEFVQERVEEPLPVQPQQSQPRPLAAPGVSVTLDMPNKVFLGEDFTFTVTFDNNGTDPGYGPFIDLVFPVTGADGDDGVDFVSATYLGAAVESVVQTFPDDGTGTGCVTHPWLRDNTGAYKQVCGKAGDKLVSLRLPFGSFVPDQPPADITIQAHLSNKADVGTSLPIRYRGGYMYGATPEDDWCCGDTPIAQPSNPDTSTWPSGSVAPVVMTMSKSYNGPANTSAETATGPNYPRSYTIAVDIATGQQVAQLRVVDTLPDDVQFISYTVKDAGGNTLAATASSTPSTTSPGGTLDITLTTTLTGANGDDVFVTVTYYVPYKDAGGALVIDASTGAAVSSTNSATVSGSWTPKDPRDTPAPVSVTAQGSPGQVTVTHRSLAIQKSVSNKTDSQNSPGDVLEYTLTFQVSDFFAFDQIVVTDIISDGQHFDSSFVPTLQINGNTYTLAAAAFQTGNYDVLCNYTGGPGAECTGSDSTIAAGKTKIVFRVSDEIIDRGQNGRLIGGCIDPVKGSASPSCDTYNDGATEGTIVFRTVIQEQFTDDYPSGDPSVDQGDKLDDQVEIQGRNLNTGTFQPTGYTVTDDATADLTIGRRNLQKSIYAINGSTTLPTDSNGNVIIKPGDEVTFRLKYVLPTSDEEELSFDDYLPLPVFHVDDPDQDGNPGPAWTFSSAGGIPSPGVVTLGPDDTFYQYMSDGVSTGTGTLTASSHNTAPSVDPVVDSNAAANKIMIYYANYDDTRDQQTIVDLLFTVVVSADPFADGLLLTNQAHAFEGSTNAGTASADAIVQMKLTEPVLVSKKGVVWTSNPNATFDAATGPAGVTWLAPGNAPRWSGTISASGLDANPIDANVSGVDAGDIVTFAITIRNTGSSLKGAFDIRIRDVLNTNVYQIPTTGSGLNLQIYYGDGSTSISYTGLGGGPDGIDGTADDLFGSGIELQDPVGQGVCQAHDPNNNNDIIVITYDLQVKDTVHPDQAVNTEHLMHYAGAEGGPNHLPQDQTDSAQADVVADLQKVLDGTEVNTTDNASDEVAIGELVTYRLTVTIPEGHVPNAQVSDHLDSGLAFVKCVSVTPSSTDVTTDLASGSDFSGVCSNDVTVSNNGQDVTFDLGNITNANRDNTVTETVTIVYQAVTLNVSGNQADVLLNNQANFSMDAGSGRVDLTGARSAPAVEVIEPVLTLSKTASPANADAGDTITYTLVVANGNAVDDTTAYDVDLRDTIPSGLNYVANSFQTVTGSCNVVPTSVSDTGGTLTAHWDAFPSNKSCTFTYQVTVDYSVAPGQTETNTAHLTWTSLSGDQTAPRSTYNTASTERTGADGVGGALNDYAAQDSATVTVNNTQPQKYLKATSESFTGDPGDGTPRVAIGEIVRYRLVVQIPEGTSDNFQIQDLLPPGLIFLDDGTAKAAFVSNGGITSSSVGTAVPAITDPDCFLTGSSADGTTPAIPSTCSPLADGNVSATSNVDQDDDTFGTGTDVYFRLGKLVNNDSDPDGEYVVLEFNALVDNHAGAGTNDAGDVLSNRFRVYIGGAQNGNDSNAVTVRVAEPALSLNKTVSPTSADAGDTVTYTLTISAASGSDRATAFDLALSDTFDAYLNNLAVSVSTTQGATCTGNGGGSTAFSHSESFSGQTLNFSATCLDPGQSITLTVTGTLSNNTPAGYTLDNTATLTWTSLPGTQGTTSNSTGSQVTGAPGTQTGERTGSGTAPNDYTSSSTASLTVPAPTMTKSVSPTQYTIGDEITFDLLVKLPEGVTKNLQVFDNLPVGLEYVSHQIITTAAASGGLLSADFNGTFTHDPPNVTAPGGSGGDVTLDFGDTTVVADNNANNNAFVVRIVARVMNVTENQDGNTKTNTGEVRWTNPNTNATASASDTATVSIVEPTLTVNKQIASLDATRDAGDTVTYRVTVSNPTGTSHATGYDVHLTDTLPAAVTLDVASVQVQVSGGASGVTNNSSGNKVDVTVDNVPLGASVVVTYSATLNASVTPQQLIQNTADVTWTSQPGTNANERTGVDGPGGLNDYQATATTSFNVHDPYYSKSLEGTSEASTLDPNVTIGEVLTFVINVTLPEGTTPSLHIVDNLPNGLQYIVGSVQVDTTGFNGTVPAPTVNPTGSASSGQDVIIDFGQITVNPDNDNANNTFKVRLQAVLLDEAGNQNGTTLTNTATLSIGGGGGTTTNGVDVTVVEPDLNITKTPDDTTPAYGQAVTYTLVVSHTNASTADAFDVVVTDTIPNGMTYVTNSAVVPPGWTVTYDAATKTLTWKGDLSRTTVSVTLTYQTKVDGPPAPPNIGDTLSNTARLTWTSLPGVDANERTGAGGVDDYAGSATATVTVTAPNLTLSKDDGGVASAAGQVIIYHLTYANTGNIGASGVTITETVPANTTFDAANSTAGWSCANGAAAGTTCTFNVGTLAAGANGSVNFAVRVDNPLPAGVAQVGNGATIADDGTHGPESTTADNAGSDTTPVAAAPDLRITKTDGVEVVAAGSQLTYTLTVTNQGTQHATNVVVTDTIPDHTTFVSASNGGTYDPATRKVTWPTLANLNVGDTVTYTVTVTVGDPLAAGAITITNQATVQDDGNNGTDLNPADNVALDVDSVTSGGKSYQGSNQTFTADPNVAIGEILTYEAKLTVPAGRTLHNLTLTDTLGRGLAFLDCASVDLGGATSTVGNAAALCNAPTNPTVSAYPAGSTDAQDQGRLIVWNFGTVTNSGITDVTITVRYRVVVLDSAGNQSGTALRNQAVWNWNGGSVSASAAEVTVREPAMTLTKSADPTVVLPDEPITFVLHVTHTPDSQTDAYDVVLTDPLPGVFKYVDNSLQAVGGLTPTSMTYDPATHTIRVVWDAFPLGQSATVRFQATMGAPAGEHHTNTASLAWTSLPGDVRTPQSAYNTLSTERYYDPNSPVNVYGTQDGAEVLKALPETGFAPHRVTSIPPQEVVYDALDGIVLEIPKLDVRVPIVGVPRGAQGWDLTWLWDQAGWLEGTAFPTWAGNTALTAHVYLPDGEPGPFIHLYDLRWGDRVILHAYGQRYIYEVRDVRLVSPDDTSVLGHKERDWVTLITCRGYDDALGDYRWRVVVQAVLVAVEEAP